ncbi:hypothetical protein PHSY_004656 [Pseudozyma hubeiensis SY62]|uniref:Uncharacterized protein n=1 Tax=Pseudozyma hubeiensis (strain SY62) TaxID=1305764 RepID=R9P744_PSEHS|nr:hypothetical protein PHSY_004656 [Pseudozyma hubeiensis SY62]GAC97072.1 hypothetical protein PHSY_004656 [Pseudozyma hubeiensis SY62]
MRRIERCITYHLQVKVLFGDAGTVDQSQAAAKRLNEACGLQHDAASRRLPELLVGFAETHAYLSDVAILRRVLLLCPASPVILACCRHERWLFRPLRDYRTEDLVSSKRCQILQSLPVGTSRRHGGVPQQYLRNMPRSRTPKATDGSRNASADESDAPLDPTAPLQTRRTRKRPAQSTRDSSADRPVPQTASRSRSEAADGPSNTANAGAAESLSHADRQRHGERRAAAESPLSGPSTFETPNQARDRLAMMQSELPRSDNLARSPSLHRSVRSTRSSIEPRPLTDQRERDAGWRSSTMEQGLSSQSFSSRFIEQPMPADAMDGQDALMMSVRDLSQQSDSNSLQPLTIRTQNMTVQPQSTSPFTSATPMARSHSNMSPPRPTRSLPRRRASARTQTRPQHSGSNNASPSYPLRSRSTSSSNILAPSNSTANILASGHSRHNSATGCLPLGGGFDPSHLPPSGSLTPRTPLAEIPLWLADMRSDSRRSSTSSSSFLDREDPSSASLALPTRHARTMSTSSSSGPSSPGATRNGPTSPAVAFRRSLRGSRPRPSDENARVSPSPSYFGEYDALPSPSPSSFRGDLTPFDESFDANTILPSGVLHMGTASPPTPLVQVQQTPSPAMSTRSRTLNGAGSVRGRRLTNPLNTPASVEPLGVPYGTVRAQQQDPPSAFHQARSNAQERRTRNSDVQRAGTLHERRAAAAASQSAAARGSSRPSSRTSSPAHGTRSSRRRSIAADAQASPALDNSALGPRPGRLPPLQIPSVRVAREAGSTMPDASSLVATIPEQVSEGERWVHGSQAAQLEPGSPSAFSEMTSLTQGSTASESINSANGMPVTPSSTQSMLDPFAQSAMHDAGIVEAGISVAGSRAQGKPAQASRDADSVEEAAGIQLRPRS